MNKEIEQAIEWVKEFEEQIRMGLPDDVYFELVEKNATIKQGFINLEIEYNKMKRRAGSHKESAIKFNTKLDRIGKENKDAVLALEDSMLAIEYFSNKLIEIREVVKEGVHLYETYPGEFHKPEKMYKIKQILDKE